MEHMEHQEYEFFEERFDHNRTIVVGVIACAVILFLGFISGLVIATINFENKLNNEIAKAVEEELRLAGVTAAEKETTAKKRNDVIIPTSAADKEAVAVKALENGDEEVGATVKTLQKVRMFKKDSEDSKVLQIIPKETELTNVKDVGYGWLKATCNGKMGYVYYIYTNYVDTRKGDKIVYETDFNDFGYINDDTVLLNQPGDKEGKKVKKATKVKLIKYVELMKDEEEGWMLVETEDGDEGFVYGAYIAIDMNATEFAEVDTNDISIADIEKVQLAMNTVPDDEKEMATDAKETTNTTEYSKVTDNSVEKSKKESAIGRKETTNTIEYSKVTDNSVEKSKKESATDAKETTNTTEYSKVTDNSAKKSKKESAIGRKETTNTIEYSTMALYEKQKGEDALKVDIRTTKETVIYQKANSQGKKIATVKAKTTFKDAKEVGKGWLKVNYKGREAFIYYLNTNYVVKARKTTREQKQYKNKIGVITASNVNLRSKPGTTAKVIACLENGTMLDLLSYCKLLSGEKYVWYKVRVQKTGEIGFVYGQYVGKAKVGEYQTANSSETTKSNKTVVTDNDAVLLAKVILQKQVDVD